MTYEAKMRFYQHDSGLLVCRECRDDMLQNVDAAMSAYSGYKVDEEDHIRRTQFEALGPRPWAGEEEPDRYVQCDQCLGQWGPDA